MVDQGLFGSPSVIMWERLVIVLQKSNVHNGMMISL